MFCFRGYFFLNPTRRLSLSYFNSHVTGKLNNVDIRQLLMDKSKLIAARFKEINDTVTALQEQLAHYEEEFYEKYLVGIIEEKNRALEAQVQQAIETLNELEKANGRSSVTSSAVTKCKDVQSPSLAQVTQEVKTNENKKFKSDPQKEKKEVKPKENKKPAQAQEEGPVDVGRLDMRVGKIVEIKKHPDADALYVEQVDIGKPNPITVVSGLVKHVPIEEMQNRLVVILCNLKPAKMRGVLSEGMVMCASTPEKVEVLRPPPTSIPGDVISVEGYNRSPDAVMNPKKKIFETVAPDLKTDDGLCATYKGAKWFVEGKGHVMADSLKGVNVK